jgi:hypothetical protein
MKIVNSYIVYRKAWLGGRFVKVVETSDGRYFRDCGGYCTDAMFSEISKEKFEEWKKDSE